MMSDGTYRNRIIVEKDNDIRLFLKAQTLYQFKQMYTIAYDPSYFKLIIFLILSIVYGVAIHQFIDYFFVHSTLITTLIIFFTLLLIIKAVGVFVMFPGSYRYIAATIEKTQNDHLLNCIRRDMQSVQKISIKIIKSNLKLLQQRNYELQSAYGMICINTQLNVLSKSVREEKEIKELIETYTKIIFHLNKQYSLCEDGHNQDKNISISKIMMNPNILLSLQSEETLQSLRQAGESVIFLSRKIWKLCQKVSRIAEHPLKSQQILGTYKPQQNQMISIDKFQIAHWYMFGDKLFTMNSYYGYWDDIFAYSRVLVPVSNGDFVQCVVIHGQKPKESNEQQKKKEFPKIAVLICNPNGAFLQGFALASSYMNFYIRWGFQIVLWNYRGYAQSTGIPSVPKCISDVQKVYHFVNNKFQIKIQVVHGYSIGGISAISLAHKINSQSNQSIKLLVADRTLSSLDNVAQGFFRKQNLVSKFVRKISKPFVKTLFMSDCIDNSSIYIDCKCYKVCIFDLKDEIISNTASLKYGIINFALQAKRATQQQPSSESERLVDLNYKESTLLEEAESFSRAFSHLFKINNKIYENVLRILTDTDGGGQNIERRLSQISETNSEQNRIKEMIKIFRIYFTSLVIFGPKYCIPQYINPKEQQKWVQNRLEKRIQQISSMIDEKKEEIYDSEIRNIMKGLQYAKNQLKSSQMLKNRNKYGNLIISDAGHNSQIKRQYYLLENALKKSVFRQKEDISTKQDKQFFSV